MTLINVKNLSVTLNETLFANLNLTISAGDRLGLVAPNGRGKSTLLRCLAGALEPTSGEITRSRGLRVGYVEQDIPPALLAVPFQDLVLAALPEEQREADGWRADVALDLMEAPSQLRSRPLSELSGGWRRLALLARVWVTEPDILLLDEPTNHLDLERITHLEDWIAGLPRDLPVVLSSHDRAFLDGATNRTLFLRSDQSYAFNLPYSRARAALEEMDEAVEQRRRRDMKEAQQLRRQAAKLNNIGVNSGSDLLLVKTKQLKQRADQIEEATRPKRLEQSAGVVRLSNRGAHAKVLARFEDLAVHTPDGRLLFKTGKLFIHQGDRIVLLGPNGSGKSRLVELLKIAITTPDAAPAGVRISPSLVLGHSDQGLTQLPDRDTPMQLICRKFEGVDQRARALLAGAGVVIGMQDKPIGLLSGGQKARLAMLVLRLLNPNFYLLDEPTNHLDIDGQEALETELLAHGATALLTSHDRSFVKAVGDRFWMIEKKRLIEIDGPEPFFALVAKRDAG